MARCSMRCSHNSRLRAETPARAEPRATPFRGAGVRRDRRPPDADHANRKGRRYHSCVSRRLTQRRAAGADGWRLAAGALDGAVVDVVMQLLSDRAPLSDRLGVAPDAAAIEAMGARADRIATQLRSLDDGSGSGALQSVIARVTVAPDRLTVELSRRALVELLLPRAARDPHGRPEAEAHETFTITVPWQVKRRGVEKRIVLKGGERASEPDVHLVALVRNAHRLLAFLTNGSASSIERAAGATGINPIEASRILQPAFLAPDITSAILADRAPPELTATALRRISHLPTDWSAQRRCLGFGNPRER